MDYIDQNGVAIIKGKHARIQIESGELKTGKVLHTYSGLVTIRCNSTRKNPDGFLFSAVPEKTIVLV